MLCHFLKFHMALVSLQHNTRASHCDCVHTLILHVYEHLRHYNYVSHFKHCNTLKQDCISCFACLHPQNNKSVDMSEIIAQHSLHPLRVVQLTDAFPHYLLHLLSYVNMMDLWHLSLLQSPLLCWILSRIILSSALAFCHMKAKA